jgi:hypothetical protein
MMLCACPCHVDGDFCAACACDEDCGEGSDDVK